MNGQQGALVWLDQFAGYLEVERNYSSHTIRAYLNDLRQLIDSTNATQTGANASEAVAKPEEGAEGSSTADQAFNTSGQAAQAEGTGTVGQGSNAQTGAATETQGTSASWLEAEGVKR